MPSLDTAQANFIATINDGPDALDISLFAGPLDRVLLGLKAHANTISHARLVALEDSFPLTRETLGEASFNALCRDYVETPQARECDLNTAGRSFPEFLENLLITCSIEGLQRTTVELAAVEWAWLESYHAADAEPLALADIGALDETGLLAMQIRLHPASRLVPICAPLAAPLAHLVENETAAAAVLIVRPGSEVRLLALDAPTRAAVEKCGRSTTIGNLLELADEPGGEAVPLGPLLTLIGAGALIVAGV